MKQLIDPKEVDKIMSDLSKKHHNGIPIVKGGRFDQETSDIKKTEAGFIHGGYKYVYCK